MILTECNENLEKAIKRVVISKVVLRNETQLHQCETDLMRSLNKKWVEAIQNRYAYNKKPIRPQAAKEKTRPEENAIRDDSVPN
jgi:hypothetical protein